MEIVLNRKPTGARCCLGEFIVDGVFECVTLEPVDRKLTSDMYPENIRQVKDSFPAHSTAIPSGRYRLSKYYSPKNSMFVPLYENVKGFGFVEIHAGNKPEDTEACTLVGDKVVNENFIGNSKVARDRIYKKIFDAMDAGQSVFVTINSFAEKLNQLA